MRADSFSILRLRKKMLKIDEKASNCCLFVFTYFLGRLCAILFSVYFYLFYIILYDLIFP